MAETYCGRNCEMCSRREELDCPGCKAGPGKSWAGDCKLASCCREKGHESCDTCSFHMSCGTLRGRDRIPELRMKKRADEAERKARLARRAPFFGKWLWVLFWLFVPSALAGLMTNDNVVQWLPGLFWPGEILNFVCLMAYGLILLKLSSEEECYRAAGICTLVAAAVGFLTDCISHASGGAAWTLLLTLPAAIVVLVGEYREYTGHAAVLVGVDAVLSEKWERLWKWYIWSFGGLLGGTFAALLIPLLGLLVMLAAAIGVLVVSILKLVYLYQTAKIFRIYPVEN